MFTDTVEYERSVSQLRMELNEKLLSAAWSKGYMMTLEQAIDFALEKT